MQNLPKVDELKASWDDNIWKLGHKKRHKISCGNNIKIPYDTRDNI
jgi:hypothetical protein